MNDETVKISIIVPIYNVEDYIKPCIESIMGQSYKNLEIILVDDGSTDRCPEICDDYAKKDKRICVIHKHNGGLVSARKAGVSAATGEYVLNVDGDDWIERDRVEVLVRDGIVPTHADMIHLSGDIVDFEEKGKESIIRHRYAVPIKLFENDEIENTIFPLMSKGNIWGSLCSWAIQRELMLKNQMLVDDCVTLSEDYLCVWFCLLEAKSVMTLPQGGYHYVQRASSVSHQIHANRDKGVSQTKISYQVLKNQLEQRHTSEEIRKICGQIILSSNTLGYNYDWLLQKFPDYLFPFPNVKKGSRIIVYGAGKFGNRLVQGLSKTKQYPVVLWVDQNQNCPTVPGYTISSRNDIFSVDYDFVVVAIINTIVAEEVKRSLILDGVPEEKIATMDANAILEDAIPDETKRF